MIITKTPMRISFAGGGSDLKEYYKTGYGAVTSTAIDKYMFITVNKRFGDTIRVSYSKTEIVDNANEIKHNIVREALKLVGISNGIEITSIADIPKGTGLGSSSSFTVGLLNALYAFKGQLKSAEALAKDACKVEIDILKEPIGKQDQYAAAYGSLNHIKFNSDESVFVNPIVMSPSAKKELQENLILLYTNSDRSASEILAEQKENSKQEDKKAILDKMVKISEEMKDSLHKNDLTGFGELLDKGWEYKKQLASKITNPIIDGYYEKKKKAGALGGKLLGAGGGGFLLLYCEKDKQERIVNALSELKRVEFSFENQGSKIIYVEE
jgi:D-glycero-alpha-D-manno-heptose-7-phosphate kinase